MATKFNDAFWKWFGDSKVVDKHGNPLVVYHGTHAKDFQNFRKTKGRQYGLARDSYIGHFFTDNHNVADYFTWQGSRENSWLASQMGVAVKGARIIPAFLSIKNPYRMDGANKYGNYKDPQAIIEAAEIAKAAGNDGLIITRIKDGYHEESTIFIAFRPRQIKSATGNDGTWDSDDSDIRSNPKIPDDIVEAAEKSRKETEDYCIKIAGQCFEASERLYDELTKLGYDPAIVAGYFVLGDGERSDHTWLEVNGVIIDITADQFGKEFPDVWIDADRAYYEDRFKTFYENPSLEAQAEKILRSQV